MLRIIDDRHRELFFARPPARIVSLVPSDTESLFALGAADRLVGRTTYCVEPAHAVDAIPSVGGTKNADVDAIAALNPDLVLTNQEENARGQVEALARAGLPILVSFPRTVGQGIAHLARLARLLGIEREPGARHLIAEAYRAVREAEAHAASLRPVATCLPIWMDPLMTLAADTFASDLLRLAGARNVFADRARRYPLAADLGQADAIDPGDRDTRYPRITLDELDQRAPELVLLPDEPHPFSEPDAAVFRARPIPAARGDGVIFADGKDLFWPGARTAEALRRVSRLVDARRRELTDSPAR